MALPWSRVLVPAVSAAVLLAACAGGDDDGAGDGRAPSTVAGSADSADSPDSGSASPPEQFTGSVEEFYEVPDPLPPGEPGDLIRVQEVSADAATTTVRIMYHSRDAEERDRAVTGTVAYPTATPPPDAAGWPVVSWAHGTTGIAPKCAPSRIPLPALTFGVQGVAVATDYVGLGPVGELHPYLSKFAEGNAAIDAVRAARNMPETGAGSRWLSMGHSQGGHAALAAAELSTDYAPELELLGTVALSPGSDFTKSYGPVDEIVVRITGAMSLYGAVSEHPDIDPDDYVGPELAAVADVIQGECLDTIIATLAGLPADTYYANSPFDTEPAASLLLENDVGDVKVDAPLFLASGTTDIQVNIERVRSLFSRLCTAGQVTEFVVVDGADHGSIIPAISTQVEDWLRSRLTDSPATDSC